MGAEIIEGLTELRDSLDSQAMLEECFTVRSFSLDLEPGEYDSDAVRSTRSILRMSQAVFAYFLGVGVRTVQSWEQGLREPSPVARRFMDEIRRNPAYWVERVQQGVISSKPNAK